MKKKAKSTKRTKDSYDRYVDDVKQRQLNYLESHDTTHGSGRIIHISPYAKANVFKPAPINDGSMKPILIKKNKAKKTNVSKVVAQSINDRLWKDVSNVERKVSNQSISTNLDRDFLLAKVSRLRSDVSETMALSKRARETMLSKLDEAIEKLRSMSFES